MILKSYQLVVLISLAIAGCGQEQQSSQQGSQNAIAQIAPEASKIDHYYSMKDGFEYGYEAAISQDAANSGQVAAKLMMFKFAGSRDGKYQVYSKSGANVAVVECSNPCDYFKVMSFFQGEHVSTERLRATEGNIATMAIMDAINGKMDRYVTDKNGKKVGIWFDEKSGVKAMPVDNP